MEQLELKDFKRALTGLLQEIERPMKRLDQIAVENTPDTIDGVQRATEREMAIRHIELDFGRLQSIKLALQRIDEGTYGACIRCEERIGIKRLRVLPWASCCVACQNIAERAGRTGAGQEVLSAF